MSEASPEPAGVRPARTAGRSTVAALEEGAWLLLGAAMAAALALILWLGRETTFSIDELVWFVGTPDLGLDDALAPHGGHLVLTSRLVYKAVLETLGSGYEPFRLLSGGAVLLTGALFFAYASRRVGKLAAFAPTLILLVFGSDHVHVLVGNGFTVLLAISCGLGALLALDRGDRRGDLGACALLCLGVLTYTVALPFVVGAAVGVLLREDRWRRIWIVAAPVALYVIWWLWALGREESSGDQLVLSNLLLVPSWAFQALSTALGAVTGLDYSFSGEPGSGTAGAGAFLGLVAVVALGWRLSRGRVPATLWGVLAIAISLWALQAIVPTVYRTPDTSRFLYPGAVAVLLVAVEATSGVRWTRAGLIALYAVAAVGVATNLVELRDGGREQRDLYTTSARTDLGAIELTGDRANPSFDPGDTNPPSVLALPFGTLADQGDALGDYLAAAERYGPLGYSAAEIRAQSEFGRARADAILAGAMGIELAPAGSAVSTEACRKLENPGQTVSFELPPGGVVMTADEVTGPVQIRRFGTTTGVQLGSLAPDQPTTLAAPPDDVPEPWQVSVPVSSLRACVRR